MNDEMLHQLIQRSSFTLQTSRSIQPVPSFALFFMARRVRPGCGLAGGDRDDRGRAVDQHDRRLADDASHLPHHRPTRPIDQGRRRFTSVNEQDHLHDDFSRARNPNDSQTHDRSEHSANIRLAAVPSDRAILRSTISCAGAFFGSDNLAPNVPEKAPNVRAKFGLIPDGFTGEFARSLLTLQTPATSAAGSWRRGGSQVVIAGFVAAS